MATDKLINHSQGDDIIDALDDIATNLGNISYGEQTSSDKVVAMTGYQKESTAAAISPGDSLNVAIGKLEKKVDDNATDMTDKVDTVKMGVNGAEFIPTDGTVTLPIMGASGANHAVGLVPDTPSTSGTTKFLREDGNWEVPPGSGESNIKLPMGRLGLGSRRDITTAKWENKSWSGLTNFNGYYVWSDGTNIYCSDGSNHYIFNKSTSTWETKTWTGLAGFYGYEIWSDGDNIYRSWESDQYVLNKSTSTWETKTWSGYDPYMPPCIWSDGDDIYYSNTASQYVLNKSTSTWSAKSWNGYTTLMGNDIWSDGLNIYYSNGSDQYMLNKATSTWSTKTWNGLTNFTGEQIWSDGENIYYSNGSDQYVLNKATSTWETKTWSGLASFHGSNIWGDGENIYYSYTTNHYVLKRNTPTTFEVMGITSKSNAITGISNSSTGSTGQIMACHVGDASKGEDSETLYIDSIYYTADDTIAKYNS